MFHQPSQSMKAICFIILCSNDKFTLVLLSSSAIVFAYFLPYYCKLKKNLYETVHNY